MRTEEANRLKDKEAKRLKKSLSLNSSKANLVESTSTFVKDRFKEKQKKCQKEGYCNQRQGQNLKHEGKAPAQANLTESGDVIVAVVVETNIVANKTDWILDTGASRHLYANKELFYDFEESTDDECVYIGNSTTAGVMGLKLVFESNKIIISRGGDFVGKDYLNGSLFVLNIVQEITSNASTSNSAYIAKSIDLWHEAKYTKKPFKNITIKKTELLELVHSDLADFKNTVSKGGNKYYITFVDDFSRYTKRCRIFEHVFPLKYNVPSDVPNNASTYWKRPETAPKLEKGEKKVSTVKGEPEEKVERKTVPVKNGVLYVPRGQAEKPQSFEVKRAKPMMVGSDCVIIYLYMDDMLIFGPNLDIVNETKNLLSSKFEMKDLEEAYVILGTKIKRTANGFSLSRSHYIDKILKGFNCFDVALVRTPYDPSIHLRKNKESSISQTEYAKIIGSVIFLMNYTRPDIAYAVSRMSRYTHNPSSEHWNALHHLLRYLRGTMDWCLHFYKFSAVLKRFCDANWVTDNDEVSSTSGYVFTLGADAISWKSSNRLV
ncbi:uncharacterized protein [Nicotiana sylvestris]|uniref:uncharacterized protein n=1 Tax=Nicotiana sylvestris TaxID=4096 RepID=UPI00388C78E8